MTSLQVFDTTSTFSILVPTLYLLVKRKLLQVGFIKMIFVFSLVSAITELSLYILGRLSIPNILCVNIFAAVELFILALLFAELMPKRTKLVYFCLIAFALFFLFDSIFFEPILTQFQANVFMAESLVITFYCVVYYFYIYRMDASVEAVYKFGLFIILMSLMAYFMMAGLLFTYSHYVYCTPVDQLAIQAVNCILNIAKNIGLVVGIVTLNEAAAPHLNVGSMLLADKVRKPKDNRRWN